MTSAKVIKHSISGGTELITVEVEFHRFILPEVNTHRVFSRNYQSSRAVPVEKMIAQVRANPALPIHWGKNQKGMQAQKECDTNLEVQVGGDIFQENREAAWALAAFDSSRYAEAYHEAGYHKQIVNRLLEPFMWTKGIITATKDGWYSFFTLRSHKDAQPEIKLLSDKIKEAISNSSGDVLGEGEWHLPYIDSVEDFDSLEDAIKVSASCCAQVSYRTLDTSLEKAKKIYDMLNLPEKGIFKEDPPHFSPCEHIAMASTEHYIAEELGFIGCPTSIGGNFQTTEFFQYRKMLEEGLEQSGVKVSNP